MKISSFIRKTGSSIFTKLLAIIIITGIVVVLFIGVLFMIFAHQFKSQIEKNAVYYTNFLVREIGMPPDTLKALKIAQELSLHIRFENPDFNWTTNPELLSFKDFDIMTSNDNESIKSEWEGGMYIINVNRNSGRYLFAFDLRNGKDYRNQLIALLAITVLLVLTVAYLSIRWILKPIKWLSEGVEQIKHGNLDYQVPVNKMDELGNLTVSLNSMTNQIRETIRSKERLLSDVSHELRSPLTRINVALEFVPDGDTKENIKEDLSEMEKMILEILETERLNSNHGKLNLKQTNLTQVVKEVSQDFEGKPPGVKCTSMPEKIIVEIDTDRIKTVLKNILENSLKYSKPESQPVEISIDVETELVTVKIKDYGSGIPNKELPFIFEPFYRTDKSRSRKTGGYGLGMSLCKKIMEAHKGVIEIKSNLDVGTTVILKFKIR